MSLESKFPVASTLVPRPIKWIFRGWVPAGELVCLAGNGGAGKSTLAAWMASRLSLGLELFGEEKIERGGTLIVNLEDDAENGTLGRLVSCGADLGLIKIYKSEKKGALDVPDLFQDSVRSEIQMIADRGINDVPVRLIVFDPIVSFVRGDANSAVDVRASLDRMGSLVSDDRSVIFLAHTRKNFENAESAMAGSADFRNRVRRALQVATLGEGDAVQRFVFTEKANFGANPGAFEFRIENEGDDRPGKFVPVGLSPLSGSELIARRQIDGKERPEREACKVAILRFLDENYGSPDDVTAMDLQRAISPATGYREFSKRSFERARAELQKSELIFGWSEGRGSPFRWRITEKGRLFLRQTEPDSLGPPNTSPPLRDLNTWRTEGPFRSEAQNSVKSNGSITSPPIQPQGGVADLMAESNSKHKISALITRLGGEHD